MKKNIQIAKALVKSIAKVNDPVRKERLVKRLQKTVKKIKAIKKEFVGKKSESSKMLDKVKKAVAAPVKVMKAIKKTNEKNSSSSQKR